MKVNPLLFSTGLFSLLSFLRRAIFYAFFYIYLRTFLGLSNTLAATTGTANLLGSTIGQLLIWGPRLNQNPSLAKKYVVRGEVIAGVIYFIAFTGHRMLVLTEEKLYAAIFLIFALSFLELFWSSSDLGIRHLISEATQGGHRGRLIGSIDTMGLIGQIVGFLISGVLYQDGLGFFNGSIFFIVIILLFSCAMIIYLTPIKLQAQQELDISLHFESNGLREVLREKAYSQFLIVLAILTIGIYSSSQIFLYYTTNPTGLSFSDQDLSLLLILFSISGGLLSPIGGRISDQIGRFPVLIFSSLGAGFCYFAFFILGPQPFYTIAIIYAFLGGTSTLLQSIAFAYSADVLPKKLQGTGFGLFNITLATGWGLAGFLIGGPVADTLILLGEPIVNAYRFSFLISTMIILIGALLLGFVSKQNKISEILDQ